MPKVYFCKQMKDSEMCGESDPKNFENGRYSTCRSCRSKSQRDKKAVEKDNTSENKTNSLDPSRSIRYIIEDTILRVPLLEGETILKKIRNCEEDISDLAVKQHNLISRMETNQSYLLMYIQKLEAEIQLFKKNNSN